MSRIEGLDIRKAQCYGSLKHSAEWTYSAHILYLHLKVCSYVYRYHSSCIYYRTSHSGGPTLQHWNPWLSKNSWLMPMQMQWYQEWQKSHLTQLSLFWRGRSFLAHCSSFSITQVSLITVEIDSRPALLEKLSVALQVSNIMDTRMINKCCYHSMHITDTVNDQRLDTVLNTKMCE